MSRRRTALRWTGYVGLALVFAIACAFLSNWQFARNEERARQLELVEQNYDATPTGLADVLAPGRSLPSDAEWRPVELHGRYLADEQVLVRNRAHGGTSAFEVLVPFRLDDGRVLIVNRGWVPPGDSQPEPDHIPAPPPGDATVVVRLKPGEPLPASGRSAPEGQVPTVHLPLILPGETGVEHGAYGILVSEDPAPDTRPNPLADPSEDPGPHLSYAIQWILFAVMGFVFIWYVIRSERRARREDAEEAEGSAAESPAAASRAPRRRDRDADDEDAILDEIAR